MENIDWSAWIIAGSAFITAVATGVLAYITWRYVRLTRRYVTLTQEMLENTYRPEIDLHLLNTGRVYRNKVGVGVGKAGLLILRAKNIGPGVARKVEFKGHDSFNPDPDSMGNFPLQRVYFLGEKRDRLLPGEELKSKDNLLGYKFDMASSDLNKFQVTITGTWEDAKGKEYCDEFPLNFADPNTWRK